MLYLRVTINVQSTYDTEVVGNDQDNDVAVLWMNAPKDKLIPTLVHLAQILTLVSDTFDQMSEISPNFLNFFKSHPKPSLYRRLETSVAIPTLRGKCRSCDVCKIAS